MTNEEALKRFKWKYNLTKDYNDPHWESGECREHSEWVEQLEIAINAIEKQIPRKPLHWDDCEQFYIECPCCGKRYDSRLGYKGCPYCLQAIRLE